MEPTEISQTKTKAFKCFAIPQMSSTSDQKPLNNW